MFKKLLSILLIVIFALTNSFNIVFSNNYLETSIIQDSPEKEESFVQPALKLVTKVIKYLFNPSKPLPPVVKKHKSLLIKELTDAEEVLINLKRNDISETFNVINRIKASSADKREIRNWINDNF